MSPKAKPFNIALLKLTPQNLAKMRPVITGDIYDGQTTNLHPDGIFSTEIFGRVGDPIRDLRFSYVPLKTTILHPNIFFTLNRLRGLYQDILSGRSYATWDDERKDFVSAPNDAGVPTTETGLGETGTGFAFFMKYFPQIQFRRSNSHTRNIRIDLIDKYREEAVLDNFLVMPAGLRDIQVDQDGRTQYDDINGLYLKMIRTATTIVSLDTNVNSSVLDVPRWSLQMTANEIYLTLEKMYKGKKGFIQGKWGRRRVFNGTRNVISSMDVSAAVIGSPDAVKITDSVVGLYQTLKGVLPLAIYYLQHGWLGQVFTGGEHAVPLVNKKTLRRELVDVNPETRDRWGTTEGLEQVITRYGNPYVRYLPIEIEGYYLGLVYKPKGAFKIFGDISELPEGADPKDVHPLTLVELLYLCGYNRWNDLIVLVTRYPITGMGSIYPSTVYLKTTLVKETRAELDENWRPYPKEEGRVAYEYPLTTKEAAYHDTLSPNPSMLEGLTADFDGDTVSGNFIYSDEGLAECRALLKSRQAYINVEGRLDVDPYTTTVELVLLNMTGE